ncbi:hypothetical protein VTH06DRAFT_8111 [Thermothelomyces fergusii]
MSPVGVGGGSPGPKNANSGGNENCQGQQRQRSLGIPVLPSPGPAFWLQRPIWKHRVGGETSRLPISDDSLVFSLGTNRSVGFGSLANKLAARQSEGAGVVTAPVEQEQREFAIQRKLLGDSCACPHALVFGQIPIPPPVPVPGPDKEEAEIIISPVADLDEVSYLDLS